MTTRRQALAGLSALAAAGIARGQVVVSGGSVVSTGGGILAAGGGGGSVAPLVLYLSTTDVPSGIAPSGTYIPSGMSAANYEGENSQGGYLSIYGVNFGSAANLGISAGARVYINGQEIANYRALVPAVSTANNSAFAVYRIDVQVGSAAYQALTIGTPYQLSVVVNGVASNTTNVDGNALTIIPTQAPVVFVDETNGSDSNAGTISAPIQHIQTYGGGSAMTGACASNTTVSGGKSNGVQAGIQFVLRNTTGSNTFTYSTTHSNSWVEFFRVTGCIASTTPTGGLKGVNVGSIKITAYPGAIAGNSPEQPYWVSSSASGAFLGADSARTQEENPYGVTGYSQWIHISNLKVLVSTSTSDGGPCNIDYQGLNWWVVNNDLSWPTTANTLSAGIAGDGLYMNLVGNFIHDIGGTSMNHAIYLDGGSFGGSAGCYASNNIVAYNYIYNCYGGSGIQTYNQDMSGTDSFGHVGLTGNSIHHNWIDMGTPALNTTGKYGINAGSSTVSSNIFCNVVLNCQLAAIRFDSEETMTMAVLHNTCYNAYNYGASDNAIVDITSTPHSGSVLDIRNNIFVMGASRSNPGLSFYTNSAGSFSPTFNTNLCYDPEGHTTSGGSVGAYGNPLFDTDWTAFALQVGSPAIGAGSTSTLLSVPYDFAFNPMIRSGQTKPSVGAFQ